MLQYKMVQERIGQRGTGDGESTGNRGGRVYRVEPDIFLLLIGLCFYTVIFKSLLTVRRQSPNISFGVSSVALDGGASVCLSNDREMIPKEGEI
ncbi:MAG: hypothetical protein A2026_03485 [Deltaproteobacteria bacterium RBG_19FT_COMBO_46_12]|nr:MAG: hypothetical protein A2026_03485 [Deltaproteobacteria bacterium RBG_19FT_COMBO_46_12]